MKISTGKGTISLPVLLAIWSVSAVTSLPGLAVSPILGDLNTIFPSASDLEIQMLTSLPSLLIIPFVLLSGKLSVGRDKLRILVVGLVIFLLSGIACLFIRNITALILVSCILGIGAGMVIPLSTGLVVAYFTGEYRVRQLGYSSSINNLTLVLATALSGYLANIDWHLSFLVYTLPGRFARPLAVPASAAFDARTGRQRPDAQQNDRSPEARPTHGALLFHHLRRTDDHLLRRVSGRRISSAQNLFGCADFALLPRNHGSRTDSRPHHRNLQRLYERRRHCHDRRRAVLLRDFPGPRDAGSSERCWRDSATD